MSDEKPMGQVIQINEARIREHLGEIVRGTVEETLNAMLDAEVDQLCGAGRYERSKARQDTRAGSYERTLQTSAGDVNLKMALIRGKGYLPFMATRITQSFGELATLQQKSAKLSCKS
ncbi:MAG: transposase [Steroidobacteraceae bacterium]